MLRLGLQCLIAVSMSIGSAQDFLWNLQEIGQGTKPALALTSYGQPVVVYMLEREQGWVKSATFNDGRWQETTIAEGYFYGPPDVVIHGNGSAHATFHDHQAQSFDPNKGDAAYAVLKGSTWEVQAATNAGHDGWDNRITVDRSGRVHMSAIDPREFNGVGVEYYTLNKDGSWQVESVGSGPLTYKYGTAIAVDALGTPYITYYGQSEQSLRLATRGEDGWSLATIDDTGDTGLFSSLVNNSDTGLHVSYLERTSDTSGAVKYAHRASSDEAWTTEDIGTLEHLFFGFTGARNITDIVIDIQGRPWVAYSDEQTLHLAVKYDGAWQTQTVVEADANPLGQIVSLAVDSDGMPHLVYSVITNKTELDGTVWYAQPEEM